MANSVIVEAYQNFMETALPWINIDTESQYKETLETLESVLESAGDTRDDPLNPLIDMLSQAIERYESRNESVAAFDEEAESLPVDVALLRTLMRQYRLTGSDFPEIGDKTMVSKVLKGKRILSRKAIEKLSERFGLRPALFFGA